MAKSIYVVGRPVDVKIPQEYKKAMKSLLESNFDTESTFKVIVDKKGFAMLPGGASVSADKLEFV